MSSSEINQNNSPQVNYAIRIKKGTSLQRIESSLINDKVNAVVEKIFDRAEYAVQGPIQSGFIEVTKEGEIKGKINGKDLTEAFQDKPKLLSNFKKSLKNLRSHIKASGEPVVLLFQQKAASTKQTKPQSKLTKFQTVLKSHYDALLSIHSNLVEAQKNLNDSAWVKEHLNSYEDADIEVFKEQLKSSIESSNNILQDLSGALSTNVSDEEALVMYLKTLEQNYSSFAKNILEIKQHSLSNVLSFKKQILNSWVGKLSHVLDTFGRKNLHEGLTKQLFRTKKVIADINTKGNLYPQPQLSIDFDRFQNTLRLTEKKLAKIDSKTQDQLKIVLAAQGIPYLFSDLIFEKFNLFRDQLSHFNKGLLAVETHLNVGDYQEALHVYHELVNEILPKLNEAERTIDALLESVESMQDVDKIIKSIPYLKEFRTTALSIQQNFTLLAGDLKKLIVLDSKWEKMTRTNFLNLSSSTNGAFLYEETMVDQLVVPLGKMKNQFAINLSQYRTFVDALNRMNISNKDFFECCRLYDEYGKIVATLLHDAQVIEQEKDPQKLRLLRLQLETKAKKAIPQLNALTSQFKKLGGKEFLNRLEVALSSAKNVPKGVIGEFQSLIDNFHLRIDFLNDTFEEINLRISRQSNAIQSTLIKGAGITIPGFTKKELKKLSDAFENYLNALEPIHVAYLALQKDPYNPNTHAQLRKAYDQHISKVDDVRKRLDEINDHLEAFQIALTEKILELEGGGIEEAELRQLKRMPNFINELNTSHSILDDIELKLSLPQLTEKGAYESFLKTIQESGNEELWKEALKENQLNEKECATEFRMYEKFAQEIKKVYQAADRVKASPENKKLQNNFFSLIKEGNRNDPPSKARSYFDYFTGAFRSTHLPKFQNAIYSFQEKMLKKIQTATSNKNADAKCLYQASTYNTFFGQMWNWVNFFPDVEKKQHIDQAREQIKERPDLPWE